MRYNQRGVSASKEDVHEAIKHLDKGLYPNAFCKILPDLTGGSARHCAIMHTDTAGTKTNLAYIYWKETGDLSVWAGIAQDAIVMNLDDMACAGCTDNFILSNTIGRNKNLIPGEVLTALIKATGDFAQKMADHGIHIQQAGGETADVGDVVRTIDVGYTAYARMKRSEVIANDIKPGDVIIGLASFGKTNYDPIYNGGMGCNGLTSARHDVLSHQYSDKYPETFDPAIDKKMVYSGSRLVTETIDIPGGQTTVGKLILSPTRTFLPALKALLDQHRKKIHGLIHCTGGGQTKVQKFLKQSVAIKNNLFDTPPLFDLIQRESKTDWREMYQVFNMGHRMEIYAAPRHADSVLSVMEKYGIEAKIVGHVKRHAGQAVTLETPYGKFEY